MNVESEIKISWRKFNNEGIITFRSDTLTKRKIPTTPIPLYLVHNASRDIYDKSTKQVSQASSSSPRTCPFCDDSNPELFQTEDKKLRVFGNRFACLQYQSILATVDHQENVSIDFLIDTLSFAQAHPELTFLYNSKNAGKTVSHLFWLISFQKYENLINPVFVSRKFLKRRGIKIQKRDLPTFMLVFDYKDQIQASSQILFELISYLGDENFNIFLFRNTVYFIPRENIEVPEGFGNHRFGGLELIGSFVMKSKKALENADPESLLSGMKQIQFTRKNQEKLEAYLSSFPE